jgi:hypothetical protein
MTGATALRFAGEIAREGSAAMLVRAIVVAAGLGQIVGLALFFHNLWPRIRTVGTQPRVN